MHCFICKEKISEEYPETLRYVFVVEEDTGDRTYFCPSCTVNILADNVSKLLQDHDEILFRRF